MLNATFVDENNEEQMYYEGPIAGMYVDHHYNQIKKFLEESSKKEIITESDARNLLPREPTPGRFYGLVKNQKPIVEGDKIPPLRPVVSGSGSNTEMISWLVDQEAKHMVPKLDSYWQDTPHALREEPWRKRTGGGLSLRTRSWSLLTSWGSTPTSPRGRAWRSSGRR